MLRLVSAVRGGAGAAAAASGGLARLSGVKLLLRSTRCLVVRTAPRGIGAPLVRKLAVSSSSSSSASTASVVARGIAGATAHGAVRAIGRGGSLLMLPLTIPFAPMLIERTIRNEDRLLAEWSLAAETEGVRRPSSWWEWFGLVLRSLQLGLLFGPLLLTYPLVHLAHYHLHLPWVRSAWTYAVRTVAAAAGPCWIKLVQWAATRPDLFSHSITTVLSRLHSNSPEHSFTYTQYELEHAYGCPISDIFSEFDERPIASGAVAQVHRAVLKSNGRVVAVKVRHPSVVRLMKQDLTLLRFATDVLSSLSAFSWMSLGEALATFANSMRSQLDLQVEAANLIEFRKNFQDMTNVAFPEPFPELCHSTVLVESFEEGRPVQEMLEVAAEHPVELRKQYAALGLNIFLKMLFVDNFIHADLHPGNLLVRIHPQNGPEIVVLDVGLVSRLSADERRNFLDLFSAVAEGDGHRAAQLMIERAKGNVLPTPEAAAGFVKRAGDLFEQVARAPISEINVGHSLNLMLDLANQYHVRLDGNFSTLVASIIVIEGIARQLHAEFSLMEEARPLLRKDPEIVSLYLKAKFVGFAKGLW